MSDSEFTPNYAADIPDEVPDFGDLLRRFRTNHGYTLQEISKAIGLPVTTISEIELSKREIPNEAILRLWCKKLGLGQNTHKVIRLSRNYKVRHWLTLNRKESCNPDILRLIDVYRRNDLTDYDRALLKLIAR